MSKNSRDKLAVLSLLLGIVISTATLTGCDNKTSTLEEKQVGMGYLDTENGILADFNAESFMKEYIPEGTKYILENEEGFTVISLVELEGFTNLGEWIPDPYLDKIIKVKMDNKVLLLDMEAAYYEYKKGLSANKQENCILGTIIISSQEDLYELLENKELAEKSNEYAFAYDANAINQQNMILNPRKIFK